MHLMTTLFGSGTLEAVEGQKLPTEYALQMYASHGELRFGGDLHFERAVPAGVVVGRKMYLELQRLAIKSKPPFCRKLVQELLNSLNFQGDDSHLQFRNASFLGWE